MCQTHEPVDSDRHCGMANHPAGLIQGVLWRQSFQRTLQIYKFLKNEIKVSNVFSFLPHVLVRKIKKGPCNIIAQMKNCLFLWY